MKIHRTRYSELNYSCFGRCWWQFVDASTGFAQIGPFYGSREELLGDLERYATLFGCSGTKKEEAIQ